jgi:peptide deformylase
MISTNTETLRNISLDFVGSQDELDALFNMLIFELSSSGQKGVGLAGIQINIPIRVAVVVDGKNLIKLYNTKILKQEQPYIFRGEGCMSFKGQFADTQRYNHIVILNGDGKEYSFSGFTACVVQHELGHFDGKIFTDYKV